MVGSGYKAVIYCLNFHRIYIQFWVDGLQRRIKAVFYRFIAVSDAICFDLGYEFFSSAKAKKAVVRPRIRDAPVPVLTGELGTSPTG